MVNTHSKHITFKQDPISKGLVIVISKKVAKLAVVRNKLRRRIKEIVRLKIKEKIQKINNTTNKSNLNLIMLGILYTRKGITNLTFKELQKEVENIIPFD